jgi:hypothetical protein
MMPLLDSVLVAKPNRNATKFAHLRIYRHLHVTVHETRVQCTVGTHGNRANAATMKCVHRRTCLATPRRDCLVYTEAGKHIAVWPHGNSGDIASVTIKGLKERTVVWGPHFDGFV